MVFFPFLFYYFWVFCCFHCVFTKFFSGFFCIGQSGCRFSNGRFYCDCYACSSCCGWLADKFESLFILMACFLGLTIASAILAFSPAIHLYTVGTLSIALAAGIGNGVIFKLVPFYFSKQAGTVNGIVSMMGGLGGFFPPLLLS